MPGPPAGALCSSCSVHWRTACGEGAHDLAKQGTAACCAAQCKARAPVPGPNAAVLCGGLVACLAHCVL
jgi:hypothetical protein